MAICFGLLAMYGNTQTNKAVFLNLSDIHFNPYYDPSLTKKLMSSDASQWQSIFETSAIKTYSTYGQDCNYPLLISLIKNMQARLAKPDYMIITGDFLCHNFQSQFTTCSGISYQADSAQQFAPCHSFIQKTMQFLAGLFTTYFPHVPVYAALGNNDSYCGDYLVQPDGAFLSMLAAIWKPLLYTDSTISFDTYFPQDGYYSIQSAVNKKQRMIILNTILFSTSFNDPGSRQPYCTLENDGKDNDGPGLQELAWLKKELDACRAAGQKAWIIQHIPPGMNVFNTIPTSDTACLQDSAYFMKPLFNDAYLTVLREYAGVIAGGMAGHYHMDDFRLVMDSTGTKAVSYLHVLPAVSPIYDNNPGYETVHYDRAAAKLLDYTVYYTDVSDTAIKKPWAQEYNFATTYRQPVITAASLLAAHQLIGKDSAVANTYMRYYPVSYKVSWQQNMPYFRYYWCGMQYLTATGFAACVCGKK